jgi:hypothetical protein
MPRFVQAQFLDECPGVHPESLPEAPSEVPRRQAHTLGERLNGKTLSQVTANPRCQL